MTSLPEMTRHNPRGEYEQECPNCKRVFRTDNSLDVYCSETCKNRFNAKKYYAQHGEHNRAEDRHVDGGKYERTCPVCGREFRTNNKRTKVCSVTCRKKRANDRYYANHKIRISRK